MNSQWENIQRIRQSIATSALSAGRDPDSIRLIAVSKTQPIERIQALQDAGLRDFGENRAAELLEKWSSAPPTLPPSRLHFVGPLQSNKVADILTIATVLHSVDRPSLLQAIAKSGHQPEIFLQVNIGMEPQKSGCALADLPDLLHTARTAGLNVVGLMAIPPVGLEAAPYFALLQKLARDHGLPRLSMGMSQDFTTAIQLGATDIRLGTALFGDD